MAPESYLVEYRRESAITTVTLNAPDTLNAIDLPMASALLGVLTKLSSDGQTKAVILQGAGRAFSAGGNLNYFLEGAEEGSLDMEGLAQVLADVVITMRTMDIPVIAKVHKVAAGGGVGLAFFADFCLAAEGTVFVPAFVKLGLASDVGLAYILTRTLGMMRATQILMTDQRFSAEDACRWGLITEVCAPDQLDDQVQALATQLVNGPGVAYAGFKKQIWAACLGDLEPFLRTEAQIQGICARSPEFAHYVRAVIEKTKS